jgi:hypothetical protein
MFASFHWQLHDGPRDRGEIESAIVDVFQGYVKSRLLDHVLLVEVADKNSVEALSERLTSIALEYSDQFYFVLFGHYSGTIVRYFDPSSVPNPPSGDALLANMTFGDDASEPDVVSIVGHRALNGN